MTRPPWVYHFADPPPDHDADLPALLGGKGASLKEMTRAGLRVPPGFTISTECCRRFFELGRWPEGLEEEVRGHLARLERETGRAFGRGRRPLLVSVRSGAAVSMPGMMDTLLNCGLWPGLAGEVGDTPRFWEVYLQFACSFARVVDGVSPTVFAAARGDPSRPPAAAVAREYLRVYEQVTGKSFPTDPWEVLARAVDAVFASWRSQRAVAYRRRHGMSDDAGTAVTVQEMFPSQVSGVLFTRDPNDPASERMIIEAAPGLGEAIVSGEVTPDRFLVLRGDSGDVHAQIGRKGAFVAALADGEPQPADPDAPSLAPPQVAELAALGLSVERHFGRPVDIEWGWADGKFALLQARAIRGLEVLEDVEQGRREEIVRLRALADGRPRVWVAHNLGETLPAPTPLTWSIVRRFMSGRGGFGQLYRDLGYRPSRRVMREGFLERIAGRVYADPERLAELFWDGMPIGYDVAALRADRNLLDGPPAQFDPDKADGRFLLSLPGNVLGMWRAARIARRFRPRVKEHFEKSVLPGWLAYVDQKRSQDWDRLYDDQLYGELVARVETVVGSFAAESLKPGFFGGLAFKSLESRLVQLAGKEQGSRLAVTLTTALEGDTTFEQDALLYRVARGEATLAEFLERFGHRAVGEMELSRPRWREDPAYLAQVVERMNSGAARDPRTIHDENRARFEAAARRLPEMLAEWGGSSFREEIERDVRDARDLLPYRESGKHYLMMGYELIRQAIEAMARRLDLGRDIYFLELEELANVTSASRDELAETTARRRIRWHAWQRLDLPDVIDSQHLDQLGRPQPLSHTDVLAGAAIAGGAATGTVRVVFSPESAGDLGSDYVLVCPSTDPGWTPLFLGARGLVVERGGMLSHGAIVARDFGIPAVACAHATRLLKNGDRVRIDGNTGRVAILQREARHA
jgi:phosphohistidine swiveling domain-containing protein